MQWDFSHNGPNQQFGRRPRNGGEWHLGRDYGTKGKLKVPLGVPAYCQGWICYPVLNNKVDGHGNQVVLIHPNGKEMVRFVHIETGTLSHLKAGQIMQTGDWIGNIGGVGNQENSYQPHIHVEHGFNPKYELAEVKSGKKVYRGKMWFCGDHTIDDYQDPNLKALPFSELETLTNMAYQSRAEIQAGRGRKVKISSVPLSKLLAKESDKEANTFSFKEWFKSTWIGRLFYAEGDGKEAQPAKRTGPIIHRKTPISSIDYQKEGESSLSNKLAANGFEITNVDQKTNRFLPKKTKEMS